MLACSSKRALSSTRAATCLPRSAARMSDCDDRAVARGPVQRLLDGSTCGIVAPPGAMNASTDVAKRVVGVVDEHVAARGTPRTGRPARSSARAEHGLGHGGPRLVLQVGAVEIVHAHSRRGRAARDRVDVLARRGPARGRAARGPRPVMPGSTSRRTARPNRRRRSSISTATRRSSASSSSRVRSALRVTRNGWRSITSRPKCVRQTLPGQPWMLDMRRGR